MQQFLSTQAEFSFVQWPFSLKLFWAPIVDSIFSQRFGRRKTWLIPTQYLMGMFMLLLSNYVDHWLGKEHENPNIAMLTALFFGLNVLAATQDIVVDGWALTMLKRYFREVSNITATLPLNFNCRSNRSSRCNVGYASTCNSVGQTAGYFVGYVLFISLESAEFCNSYLRSTPSDEGILTLPGEKNVGRAKFPFMQMHSDVFRYILWRAKTYNIISVGFLYFWGWTFIATTTLIALFKHEDKGRVSRGEELNTDIKHAYKLLWDIVQLPTIKTTILFLLTAKVEYYANVMNYYYA